MVKGIEGFREWFRGYEDQYVIIGGVACDLLMEEAGQPFRATKDLDMVLLVEAITPEFIERFWQYIETAGYEHKNKSTGDLQFYRFSKPTDLSRLPMIELFSRRPDEVFLAGKPHLTPIPVEEEISSLSAILLDDVYYRFLLSGRIIVDGVPVLESKYLIPFKAKAYLDNRERQNAGGQVDSRNIKKHKNDVFRLLLMLGENETPLEMPNTIRTDMATFISNMESEDVDVKALGAGRLTKEILVERLKAIYGD